MDVLHHDVAAPFVRARVVNGNYAGVLKPRDNGGFAFKGGDRVSIGVGRKRFSEGLHRDPAAQALILGQPDLGHAPGTEQPLEAVSSVNDVRSVQVVMKPSEIFGRERNLEFAFVCAGLAFLFLGRQALDSAAFPLPCHNPDRNAFAVHRSAAMSPFVIAPRAPAQVLGTPSSSHVGLVLSPTLSRLSSNQPMDLGRTPGFCGFAGSAAAIKCHSITTRRRLALTPHLNWPLRRNNHGHASGWSSPANHPATELLKLLSSSSSPDISRSAPSRHATRDARREDVLEPSVLVPLAGVLFATVAALALLKDLGSIALLVLLGVAMLYLATGRARYLIGGVVLLAATGLAGYVAFDHAQVRIDTWLDPGADPGGAGYQTMQATYPYRPAASPAREGGLGNPESIPPRHR